MSADTKVECRHCGRSKMVSFSRCLSAGWPKCCGWTMALVETAADIDQALGDAFRSATVSVEIGGPER